MHDFLLPRFVGVHGAVTAQRPARSPFRHRAVIMKDRLLQDLLLEGMLARFERTPAMAEVRLPHVDACNSQTRRKSQPVTTRSPVAMGTHTLRRRGPPCKSIMRSMPSPKRQNERWKTTFPRSSTRVASCPSSIGLKSSAHPTPARVLNSKVALPGLMGLHFYENPVPHPGVDHKCFVVRDLHAPPGILRAIWASIIGNPRAAKQAERLRFPPLRRAGTIPSLLRPHRFRHGESGTNSDGDCSNRRATWRGELGGPRLPCRALCV